MPLFEYQCLGCVDAPRGHRTEHYYPSWGDAPALRSCRVCGAHAERMMPLFNPLQYFSESHGRVIQNLDRNTVLRSHGEHQRLMKEKGVEPATQWHASTYKQTDGLVPKAAREHPRAVME